MSRIHAAQIETIGNFCIRAADCPAAEWLLAAQELQQQLAVRAPMHGVEPALTAVFATLRAARLQQAPTDETMSAVREATLRLTRSLGPHWRRTHPLSVPDSRFPTTGFGKEDLNGKRRHAMRKLHKGSALVAAGVALASPSFVQVRRDNRAHLAELHTRHPALAAWHGAAQLPPGVAARDVVLAQFTEATLDRVRDQLLEHMDDAFLTNVVRNAEKAGGKLLQLIRGDDRELTRTRSQLVAEMIALDNPRSALNRALEQLAPRMLQHRRLADMGEMETDDFVLRLAAQAMDNIMRPTPVEARRTAEIVADLGPAAQREFDLIHLNAMKRLQVAVSAMPADSPAADIQELVTRETRRTTRQIDSARTQFFDDFRQRNSGEFGYNEISEQVRENTNIEYYKTVFLSGPAWAAGARLVGAAFTVIGGPVGLALTVASAAVLQYVTAVTSQASTGATGAASTDLKPFDSATMPRPLVDPQLYVNQRKLGKTVQQIGMAALDEYTRPGNPAAMACRATVHTLECTLGYDLKARSAMAPELFALTEYHDHMMGHDAGGLDHAVPAPIRIAQLLHTFAGELPSLKNLIPRNGTMSEATRRTVIETLVEAIHRKSDKPPLGDAATIAERARIHGAELLEAAGLDRAGFAAFMAPDAIAMHAGGVDFSALIHTLIQSAGRMEQCLFDSKGFLSAQYRGLYVNAVVGLVVQLMVGIAAFFSISAATAAGTPAAGFGAAVAFTALSFALGSLSRNAGAVSWYKKDREAQTDSHVYRLMGSPDARPLVGDRERHVAQIEKAVLGNHVPLYKKRMDQLFYCERAAWEEQLVLGSARQAQLGFDMLHALEQNPAEKDRPRFAAELAGQSLDAMHEATSVRRHQALMNTHNASMEMVSATAAAAEQVLQQPSTAIRETAEKYLEDRESYGIAASYRYRREKTRFFADATGSIPARVALDKLRTLALESFDRHVMRHREQAGFRVSVGELESLKTALRTPYADDATELSLAALELRLRNEGLLAEGDRPHHLDVSTLPGDRVAALRHSYERQSLEVEERQRAMRSITNDMLALQAGRFDDIQDLPGVIGASLAHFSDAGQFSRHYRVNNDLLKIAFTRGTARVAGQLIPVSFQGVAGLLVVLASGGLAIAQASDAHLGAFTLSKLDAQDVQNLQAHGIEPSTLQTTGFQPRFGSLAAPLPGGLLNAVQPQTNPFTFQSSGQLQAFQAGYAGNDPSFESMVRASTQDRRCFQVSPDHWGPGLVSPDAVVTFLRTNAGATQLKRRIDRKLQEVPDARMLLRQDRVRWSAARHLSTRPWFARLGEFLPSRYWHDLTYAKNARHHFRQTENDRHEQAASLVVAGYRLAAIGAPANPPIGSELDEHCVEFASAMLHNLLQDPEAAKVLFVGRPPESIDEQHRLVMRVVLHNPWYLLRLVHLTMTRLDATDDGLQEYRKNLDEFRKILAADVLGASMPLAIRKLEHDIGLCAQRPMPAALLAELETDLRRSHADVQAMADGPERAQLMVLVDTFADDMALLRPTRL